MGSFRFRKSIKVAPGTKINLSKSGVSMTNRIAPGLSYRTQLAGGKRKKKAVNTTPVPLRWWFIALAILLLVSAILAEPEEKTGAIICAVLGVLMLAFTILTVIARRKLRSGKAEPEDGEL